MATMMTDFPWTKGFGMYSRSRGGWVLALGVWHGREFAGGAPATHLQVQPSYPWDVPRVRTYFEEHPDDALGAPAWVRRLLRENPRPTPAVAEELAAAGPAWMHPAVGIVLRADGSVELPYGSVIAQDAVEEVLWP